MSSSWIKIIRSSAITAARSNETSYPSVAITFNAVASGRGAASLEDLFYRDAGIFLRGHIGNLPLQFGLDRGLDRGKPGERKGKLVLNLSFDPALRPAPGQLEDHGVVIDGPG